MSGGITENGEILASMECLHLPTGQWSKCRPMNEKRSLHAMIAFNDEIFVFGGWWNGKNRLLSEK